MRTPSAILALCLFLPACSPGMEQGQPDPVPAPQSAGMEADPVSVDTVGAQVPDDFFREPVFADLHNDRSFFLTAREVPWGRCAGVQICSTNYLRSSSFFSLWRPPLPIGAGPPWGLTPAQAKRLNAMSHFQYLRQAIKDLRETGVPVTDDPARIGSRDSSIFLGVEGAFLLNRSGRKAPDRAELIEILKSLKKEKVSYVALVWSNDNVYAGTSRQPGKGLTERGRELVRLLIEYDFLIDLSHASDRTVFDFHSFTRGRYPLFFSHSSARALCNHPRNVSDEILRLVRETGGLVGVNFYSKYLNCGSKAHIRDVRDHILHIYRKAGADHVALGSDFDGLISLPDGLKKPQNLGALAVMLKDKNLSRTEIEKIFHGNVRNFLYTLRNSKKVDE